MYLWIKKTATLTCDDKPTKETNEVIMNEPITARYIRK